MSTLKKPIPVEESLAAREDDARELKKQPETVAQKVKKYISRAMPAENMSSFLAAHEAEIADALQEPARKKEAHARQIWTLQTGAQRYYEEQKEWMQAHPQMGSDPETVMHNMEEIARGMIRENLAPSAVNVNEAFVARVMEGRLILDATAIGAGPEDRLTGSALVRHPQLWRLLEPFHGRNADPEEDRIRRISADQYKQEHVELHDTRTPPIIREQVQRALMAFISGRPDFKACEANKTAMLTWLEETNLPPTAANLDSAFTALRSAGLLELNNSVSQHGSTRVVTYEPHQRTPMHPRKYSFRKKLDSMSATEYGERILHDDAFRESIDREKD